MSLSYLPKKSVGILLIVIAFLVGSIFSGVAFAKELKIGASLSLSGKLVREGTAIKEGYEFWVNWANTQGGIKIGKEQCKVKMIYYDDESNAQTAAKLVEKLITVDKVDLLLGPYSSGIAMPATTIAERYGYVMILPLNTSDQLYTRGYKNIFSVAPVASSEGQSLINMFKEQKLSEPPKSIAIIAANTTYTLLVANGLKKSATNDGMKITLFDKFPNDISDISSLLSVIKTKNPDILYVCGYFEHSVLVSRQLKDLNYTPKACAFTIGPQLPDFEKSLKKDSYYALAPCYWMGTMKYRDPAFSVADYNNMFKKKFGHLPTYQSAFGTSAGRVLQRALEKAGSVKQADVRRVLKNIELKETITGEVKFDDRGVNVLGKIGVVQIQDGKQNVIYPKSVSDSILKYPAVPWGKR